MTDRQVLSASPGHPAVQALAATPVPRVASRRSGRWAPRSLSGGLSVPRSNSKSELRTVLGRRSGASRTALGVAAGYGAGRERREPGGQYG
jgi:hypothetical protein